MEEFLKFLEDIKVNKDYSRALFSRFLNTHWLDNIMKAELVFYAAVHATTEDECINLCLEALKYYSNFREVYALMSVRSTSQLKEYSLKVLDTTSWERSHVYTHKPAIKILELAKTYVADHKVTAEVAVTAARIALRKPPIDTYIRTFNGCNIVWKDVWSEILKGVKLILFFGDLFTNFKWTVKDLFCAGVYVKATDTEFSHGLSIVNCQYGAVCDIYQAASIECINEKECHFLDSRGVLHRKGKILNNNKVYKLISDL